VAGQPSASADMQAERPSHVPPYQSTLATELRREALIAQESKDRAGYDWPIAQDFEAFEIRSSQ